MLLFHYFSLPPGIQGRRKGVVGGTIPPHPILGNSVNLNSTGGGGADFAHHITTGPHQDLVDSAPPLGHLFAWLFLTSDSSTLTVEFRIFKKWDFGNNLIF